MWSTQEKSELKLKTELQPAEERTQITGMGPELACGEGSHGSGYDPSEPKRHFKSNIEKVATQMTIVKAMGEKMYLFKVDGKSNHLVNC